MEALLIINSFLVAICLYFIRDFHTDFKSTAKTVQRLREKFSEFSWRVKKRVESCEETIEKVEDQIEKMKNKS